MPYISELLNNKIYDSSDEIAGKLKDILILSKDGNFAPLEYLVVKTKPGNEIMFVPYDAISNFTSSEISLKTLFNKVALKELPKKKFVYLRRDILDSQIVDVAGTRVVRVNDLRIGTFEDKMCVLAIDPSFRGLLRRLNLENTPLGFPFKVNLIDWRKAQFIGNGAVQLSIDEKSLGHLHPADLANILEELDVKHGSRLLSSLDEKEAAKVLEEVDPRWQGILVKYLGPEKAGKILGQMSSDEIVDLVKSLNSEEAKEYVDKIGGGKAQTIEKLISYPDNTAGGLMTLDFVSVRPEWTVGQTIEEIKKLSSAMRSILYIYVTAEDQKLIGIISVRQLLISAPDTKTKDLAKPVAGHSTLKPDDSINKILKLMTKYNLYTSAVLDKDRKLLGIVTIDDVLRILYPAA
jgi:magnesium transporter